MTMKKRLGMTMKKRLGMTQQTVIPNGAKRSEGSFYFENP